MTITEQDIKNLTPEHRVVWKEPDAPREVELGLWLEEDGTLRTDAGSVVRWGDGTVAEYPRSLIVRIIEPLFTPRRGMVIGHPGPESRRLVRAGESDYPWLGYAPEVDGIRHSFTDDVARYLIENHGWVVVGDLSAQGEVTDAAVGAAAKALMEHPGRHQNVWYTLARAALEAAREARND